MNTETKRLKEQLEYCIRHAKDLEKFSDSYSIKRRERLLAEADEIKLKLEQI